MKKYMFISIVFVSIFCVSCSNIDTDNEKRISGIVNACKQCPQNMDVYLHQKVENKQISETVQFTIKECLQK